MRRKGELTGSYSLRVLVTSELGGWERPSKKRAVGSVLICGPSDATITCKLCNSMLRRLQ
jgi:hypothetical protein